jgi:integrator complex subunit 1
MFVSIPKVRSLIASNLSKWLQSPALAGLARTLFSATVNHMKHEDPPLPDDLLAIDSILAMRLKANQLNAHIENITAIAKRIPTLTVVRRMYSKLLRDEIGVLSSPSHASSESTNFLKMVGAIHAVVPAQVSHDAIASTFLMMTVHELEDVNENFASNRNRLIFRLRRILRMFSAEISSSFDGVQLMKSFFEFDVNSQGWSPRNEEDKARLMFQCVTLAVAPFVRSKGKANLSETEEVSLSASLLSVRKLFLSWFCTYYGPHFSSKLRKRIAAQRDKHSVGAGLPNFRSTLANPEDEKIPAWLNTLRCMLFIEEPDSDLMRQFNLLNGAGASNESTKEWETEIDSVKLCCKYGADVTDELILIVLEASREDGEGLQPEMSLEIIENLLESCTKHREGKVKVSDPSLIWEMYNLAKYTPSTEVDPPVELPR